MDDSSVIEDLIALPNDSLKVCSALKLGVVILSSEFRDRILL